MRTLSKENAERVGRHLVMVGRLLDEDPELAYEHAAAAVSRGGRVDVVREAAGLAAYRTGRYAEALRELRTVRRLNGSSEHLPVMADCERGLGRPERALALAQEPEAATLAPEAQVELAIVVSGARLDLGQAEAAVATLATPSVRAAVGLQAVRVAQARATALEAAGQSELAAAELAPYSAADLALASGDVDDEEAVVVFDLADEEIEEPAAGEGAEELAGASDDEGGLEVPAAADDVPVAADEADDEIDGAAAPGGRPEEPGAASAGADLREAGGDDVDSADGEDATDGGKR